MKQGTITLGNNDCLVAHSVYSRPTIQSKIIFVLLIIYISLISIDAPLRYYLVENNMPVAIYLRDIIAVLIVSSYLLKRCIAFNHNKLLLCLMGILVLHSIIGLIYLPNVYMVLFGWKTFLPILVGVVSYNVFIENLNKMRWVFMFLFLISVVGIFINYFIDFPWEGFAYTLDIFTIRATSVEDITFGIKRLAGFSRYHYGAAILILLSIIFLVVHTKNKLLKIGVWLVGGLAIVLTTVKGIILSYILISILLIILKIDSKLITHYKIYRKLLAGLVILVILFPILAFIDVIMIDFGLQQDFNDLLFTSFSMRLYDAWPEAIELIRDQGNLLLGRGLGGIGQSQNFFEAYLYTPVDNVFIYLYGHFGLLGGLYLLYLYSKGRLLIITQELYLCLLLLFIFQYGITQTLFDDVLICVSLGFFLAHVNDSKLRMEYQSQLAKINH